MYDEASSLVCDYVVKIVTFCFLGLGLRSLFSLCVGVLFLYDMVALCMKYTESIICFDYL
jgi:hypothetical protein